MKWNDGFRTQSLDALVELEGESIMEPEVLHNDKTHNHSGRHGSLGTRDSYKGL